ncbi:hypothetical protein VTL71DRAFT_3416 [Oculimacula yallundae]|uniref:Uncharacterized protein n=1 Tax=Oculimacula yallundae TaxID=86028 RepID=A0ABR4C8Z2_9HELO
MKVLPLRREFFTQSPIDKDNITVVPHRESYGWLLSSPLTAIFSRMHLSSPLRAQNIKKANSMAVQEVAYRSASCQVSSDGFSDHYSVSSYSSESDSWLMEDMFEDSQGSTSCNTIHTSYDSSISQLDDHEHIYRWWDANKENVSPDPLFYPVTSKAIQVREQGQLGTTRKLPSQIQYESTETCKTQHLKRASATRSPRRKGHSRADPSATIVKPAYSAFPPNSQESTNDKQDYHMKCHSWPAPTGPRSRPQRSRANTTPNLTAIHKTSRPSNLSTCTILDHSSKSSLRDYYTPASVISNPTSPHMPYYPERNLMVLMAEETSAFSDDEDNDESLTLKSAMKSVLNLGRATNVESEKFPVEKAKLKPKRSFLRAMSSLLHLKKGATV